MWHADPVQFALRHFAPGKGFGTDPYDAICSVFVCGDIGFLFGLHGTIGRESWAELQQALRGIGIVDLMVIRKGERVWYETERGTVVAKRRVARQAVAEGGDTNLAES